MSTDLIRLPARFSPTSLALPRRLTFAEWRELGRALGRIGSGHQWWIGEWLLYGEHHYGEKYKEASAILGGLYTAHTLENIQWVADRVQDSRRRESLTWTHHETVAGFEPAEQKRWLRAAEENGWTTADLRTAIRGERQKAEQAKAPELPDGQFAVVYADPPWRYKFIAGDSRAVEAQYPTMDLEDIRALPVQSLCAPDCVLFMWATAPKLAEALSVVERWGFLYRTCAVWDKELLGMGHWFRGMHELLLLATLGEPRTPPDSVLVPSMIRARRGEHSRKPEAAREIIEAYFPKAPKVELFAREAAPGWTTWGNELLPQPEPEMAASS